MKLSTRGRYAARLMLDMSKHYGKGPVLLKDIARRQNISEKYLGQIIIPLKNAGLVHSTRGAHGGYTLSRKPQEITLKEVLETVEGDLSVVECAHNPDICSQSDSCVFHDIWVEISHDMIHTLELITLSHLIRKEKGGKL
ncbi:Rrf2 family transcriptional regulator [Candidatus Sumerlaeota bacterium]|nr:Rrf2 family transcriptional regulator [Candidatus Sumerlaeota bacterium]